MNDFDYDVLQKKRIARNAMYKKNGSKSKKCSLPHDHLTNKEIAKMAGEVKTWNLKGPMQWDTFKTMPDDLQREYIETLRKKYNANTYSLSEMLGVTRVTVGKTLDRLGLKEDHKRRVNAASWANFVNGHEMEPDEKPVVFSVEPEKKPIQFISRECSDPDATETIIPAEPELKETVLEAAHTESPFKPSTMRFALVGNCEALKNSLAALLDFLPSDAEYAVVVNMEAKINED